MFYRYPILQIDVPLEGLCFRDTLYKLCKIVTGFRTHIQQSDPHPESIESNANALEEVLGQSHPHLRSLAKAQSVRERIEHYSIHIHQGFFLGFLLRPSLDKSKWNAMPTNKRSDFANRCKHYLTKTLRSYIDLQSLTSIANRSWSLIHNGLSAAVLLAVLQEHRQNPEVMELQVRLLNMINEFCLQETEYKSKDVRHEQQSCLHSRALAVMKVLLRDNAWSHGDISSQMLDSPSHLSPSDESQRQGVSSTINMSTTFPNWNPTTILFQDSFPGLTEASLLSPDPQDGYFGGLIDMSIRDSFDALGGLEG